MVSVLSEYLVGVIVVLFLAIFAFRKEALTEGGTLTAIIVGLLVFLFPQEPFAGKIWIALLALFFMSSYFVTKLKEREKFRVVREFAKGSTRDVMQVFANGAIAALAAVLYRVYPLDAFFVAFCVVLATVNADTWATEIGVLSRQKPILLTTLKRAQRGASGAVSLTGLAASAGGAFVIAIAAVALIYLDVFYGAVIQVPGGAAVFVAFVTIFGLVGSLVDSLFGAKMQVMYYCKKCRKQTERIVHSCGRKTAYRKGFEWFDNDTVNLGASLLMGLLAFAVFVLVFGL